MKGWHSCSRGRGKGKVWEKEDQERLKPSDIVMGFEWLWKENIFHRPQPHQWRRECLPLSKAGKVSEIRKELKILTSEKYPSIHFVFRNHIPWSVSTSRRCSARGALLRSGK
jgi:hypothetical protein